MRIPASIKRKIVCGTGIAIDVIPALIATCTQFPVWIDRSSTATVSGLAILLIFFSCLPFLRQIKEYFKSPSAPVLWGVILALFIILQNIMDEMIAVCFVGTVSNIIGSIIYKVGQGIGEEKQTESK